MSFLSPAPDCAPMAGFCDRLGPDPRPKTRVLRSPLGEFLVETRQGQGLTVVEAAQKCGLHHAHLSHLECGYHHPKAATCRRIARGLGLDEARVLEIAHHSRTTFGRCKKHFLRDRGTKSRHLVSLPNDVARWVEMGAREAGEPVARYMARFVIGAYENRNRKSRK